MDIQSAAMSCNTGAISGESSATRGSTPPEQPARARRDEPHHQGREHDHDRGAHDRDRCPAPAEPEQTSPMPPGHGAPPNGVGQRADRAASRAGSDPAGGDMEGRTLLDGTPRQPSGQHEGPKREPSGLLEVDRTPVGGASGRAPVRSSRGGRAPRSSPRRAQPQPPPRPARPYPGDGKGPGPPVRRTRDGPWSAAGWARRPRPAATPTVDADGRSRRHPGVPGTWRRGGRPRCWVGRGSRRRPAAPGEVGRRQPVEPAAGRGHPDRVGAADARGQIAAAAHDEPRTDGVRAELCQQLDARRRTHATCGARSTRQGWAATDSRGSDPAITGPSAARDPPSPHVELDVSPPPRTPVYPRARTARGTRISEPPSSWRAYGAA